VQGQANPMSHTEILYPFSSIAIALALFWTMLLFNEIGFRVGRFVQEHTDNAIMTLTGSIQASVLGLLALTYRKKIDKTDTAISEDVR
jgi:hypothetical protein